ncbi:MAG: riboflavin synthase [Clostridiales bacterium]|jgi:riboflavin synthase|nr:riboflavin synthase [Eubacteriales bacterium]MDH7565344.1 riboflavin synthase [Clostridiales bacterium]
MFTGIVEGTGRVKGIIHGTGSIKLSIECAGILPDLKLGDSIAVNGICLTVSDLGKDWFTADVMPETMRKTNLSKLKLWEKVNLERALKLSDRLGGHIVSGHIDGTGRIIDKRNEDNAVWITIEAPQAILKYVVQKGSIALDGTSLTIAYVDENSFKVSLIPLTRGVTTLGAKNVGDTINIECDVIGKYIEKLIMVHFNEMTGGGKDISMDFLKEHGYV